MATTGAMAVLLMLLSLLLPFPEAYAEETVRLGFLQGSRREMSHSDVRATFDLWAQEMGTRFQVPIKVFYYEDIREMRQDFLRGKINGITADALSLARNFRIDELAEGYSVIMQGSWNLELRTGKQMKDAGNLLGKRVVLLQNDSTAETFLETLCLRDYARAYAQVFSETQKVATSNQAAMRLFFGKADLALVPSYGYELAREMNPQLESKAGQVVAELPLTGMYYAFFSARVDKEFRRRTLRMIPTMHTYPRGRQLLDLFKMDHLVIAAPTELKPFLQLDKDYLELKAQVERKAVRK
jgi:ABC-type phosphate/phosphonate transport system substrate-binding protein